MFGAPTLGCLPSIRTVAGGIKRDCAKEYNEAAQLFNSKLSAELDSLNNLPDVRIVYIDIYSPLLDIIQNPNKYGNNNNNPLMKRLSHFNKIKFLLFKRNGIFGILNFFKIRKNY